MWLDKNYLRQLIAKSARPSTDCTYRIILCTDAGAPYVGGFSDCSFLSTGNLAARQAGTVIATGHMTAACHLLEVGAMLTTTQAFEKFRQRLELSETEQRDAARRQTDVRECIRDGFDIKTDFLSGSYRRHTKTKPLKDVDVMFVLGDKEKWRRDKPPIETLQAFERCLKKKYSEQTRSKSAGAPSRSNSRRTTIPRTTRARCSASTPCPHSSVAAAITRYPTRSTGTWIKTNPEKHKEQATAKNEELDGHWVPLVKMAKGWNRANGKPIKPSFLIEVMAEELVEAPFSTYPNEVRNFFAAMEANIGRTWPDPAGLGPPVSDQMTRNWHNRSKKGVAGSAA